MVRKLKLEEVRPLIGRLSRPNYYEVNFGGIPTPLGDYLSSRGVSRNFIGGDMGLLCYEASLPGSNLATTEVANNFSGVTQNYAHRRIYTPLTLSFYSDNEYRALKFLEHWMEFVISGNGTSSNFGYASDGYEVKLKYPVEYKCNTTKITKFEIDYNKTIEYTFIGLYPESLNSVALEYGPNSQISRITCSFRYDRYIAGETSSFAYVLNRGNNLVGTLRNLTGSAIDLFNTIIN